MVAVADLSPATLPRDALIEASLPWVDLTMRRMWCGDPVRTAWEDVHEAGVIGLIRAVDQWDPSRGNSTFQTHLICSIRRAILDFLRAEGPVPRRLRERLSAAEISSGTRSQEYLRLEAEAQKYLTLLESEMNPCDPVNSDEPEWLEDPWGHTDEGQEPLGAVLAIEQAGALAAAIRTLPRRERAVVQRYYYRGQTLREIGRGFRPRASERMVSQYRRHGIALLKERLNGSAELFLGAGR
jgi:RNA polymerase sigma factor for flagellar operon FliA